MENEKCSGQPKNFEDEELKTLLDEYYCRI